MKRSIHGIYGGDSCHRYKFKLACREYVLVKSAFVLLLHSRLVLRFQFFQTLMHTSDGLEEDTAQV